MLTRSPWFRRPPATLFAAAWLAVSASGQGFNLDVGSNLILFPAPSPNYGAASGQVGSWTAVDPPLFWLAPTPLDGLDGLPTGATLETDVQGSFPTFPSVLSGEEQKLLEDGQAVPNLGVTATWTFRGLANGAYTVYTYSWTASGNTLTDVTVDGSTDPLQTLGGPWTGPPFQLGVTHSIHAVLVTNGELIIHGKGNGPAGLDTGAINGIQIIPGGAAIGASYCIAAANSTGGGALMSATGSASVAANALVLHSGPVPAQPGLFYYGPAQTQVPFGNGFRCVDGVVGRLDVVNPAGGQYTFALDVTSPPSAQTLITAGSTWNFQNWYRDPAGGGAFFNLSDGLEVMFLP
ncbi:MAG: hypothetical protein E2O39_16785 [Planctomycetota bacterium]|nr:MAG: hypothetical protein E2O39_16785 [Planctomycetota bacterium]